MTGHPDDQTYANWRGPVLGAANNVHIDSTHSITVQGYVTNFSGIQVFLAPTSFNGIFLVASFFVDATLATFTGQKQWQLGKGQDMRCVMPALGNYVQLTLSTTDVAGGQVSYAFTPTNLAAPSTRYNGIVEAQAQTGLSLAANATVLVLATFLAEGPGYVYFNDDLASAKIFCALSFANPDGTEGARIFIKPVGVQQAQQTFYAPDSALLLHLQNTDGAAAHTVDYALIIDGR